MMIFILHKLFIGEDNFWNMLFTCEIYYTELMAYPWKLPIKCCHEKKIAGHYTISLLYPCILVACRLTLPGYHTFPGDQQVIKRQSLKSLKLIKMFKSNCINPGYKYRFSIETTFNFQLHLHTYEQNSHSSVESKLNFIPEVSCCCTYRVKI